MSTIDNLRDNIIKIINDNNISDLIRYVEINHVILKELNNNEFDILIYVIENSDSLQIFQYVISQCNYETLNYSFYCNNNSRVYYPESVGADICYRGYKVPLFSAIAKKKFLMADILLVRGADINYRLNILNWEDINVVNYLYHIGSSYFNKATLKYIFSHDFNLKCLTTDLLNQFKNISDNGLEIIFNYCIFDNTFVLNMLGYFKYNIPISKKQLHSIITNQKNKIKIDRMCYDEALRLKKYDTVNLLIDYDGNPYNLDYFECYEILEKAIYFNNYNLVKSMINYKVACNFELFLLSKSDKTGETVNFENLLLEAIEVENAHILKLIIELLISNCQKFDFKSIHFEKLLIVASNKQNVDILIFIIKLLLFVLYNMNIFQNADIYSFRVKLNNNLLDVLPSDIVELGKIISEKNDNQYFNLIINCLIKIDNLESIKYLLENDELKPKIDINVKDRNDEYPIIAAFNSNNIRIFKYLIEYGANCNVNGKDRENSEDEIRPLLSMAIRKKKYRILNLLFQLPIVIDKEEFNSCVPSHFIDAIYNNKISEIELFIKDGHFDKSIHFVSNNYNFTPLSFAYILNHMEIFNILLNICHINELDYYGYSILHYAIIKMDVETVRMLINRGSNINYIDNMNGHGNAALDIAIYIKNEIIFNDLIQNKDLLLNIPNEFGVNPMITLLKINNYNNKEKEKIVDCMIKLGSDVNFIDENRNSPLVYSIQNNYLPIVRLLVEKGANINFIIQKCMDDEDHSILFYTMKLGFEEIAKFLIDNSASIDFTKNSEISYLISSSKRNHTELFEYFAKYNTKYFNYESIKQIISCNRLDLLKILVENHININMKDDKGMTPLTYAIKNSKQYFVDYLVLCGADS